MAVEKKNGKWYIRGKFKKEDGSYYEYRRLTKQCNKKKWSRGVWIEVQRAISTRKCNSC